MSLESCMDATAVRMATGLAAESSSGTRGLRAAYSVASTTEGARLIPRAVDDWPVAIIWSAGGQITAGNGPEPSVHELEVQIWCNATDGALAYQTLIPFVDRCRVLFRTDVNANSTTTRLLMTGYGAADVETAHDVPFLILPIYLQALDLDPTNGYQL